MKGRKERLADHTMVLPVPTYPSIRLIFFPPSRVREHNYGRKDRQGERNREIGRQWLKLFTFQMGIFIAFFVAF